MILNFDNEELIDLDKNFEILNEHINKVILKDMYSGRNIDCCPLCNKNNYIKYGKYKNVQRYKCRDCNKTFSKTTNSLIFYSKKDTLTWIKFFKYTLEKRSLRYTAEKLNINLATAFYWRHKVLHSLNCLSKDVLKDKLHGHIHLSMFILKENFKGCRNIETDKRRNILVIGAKGDSDNMLATELCKDVWKYDEFKKKIYPQFEDISSINAYGNRYLTAFEEEYNKKHKLNKDFSSKNSSNLNKISFPENSSKIDETNYKTYYSEKPSQTNETNSAKSSNITEKLLKINEDHSMKYFYGNLTRWFGSFSGIATKYLERYLTFFILFNLNKKFRYIDMAYDLSLPNNYLRIKNI